MDTTGILSLCSTLLTRVSLSQRMPTLNGLEVDTAVAGPTELGREFVHALAPAQQLLDQVRLLPRPSGGRLGDAVLGLRAGLQGLVLVVGAGLGLALLLALLLLLGRKGARHVVLVRRPEIQDPAVGDEQLPLLGVLVAHVQEALDDPVAVRPDLGLVDVDVPVHLAGLLVRAEAGPDRPLGRLGLVAVHDARPNVRRRVHGPADDPHVLEAPFRGQVGEHALDRAPRLVVVRAEFAVLGVSADPVHADRLRLVILPPAAVSLPAVERDIRDPLGHWVFGVVDVPRHPWSVLGRLGRLVSV